MPLPLQDQELKEGQTSVLNHWFQEESVSFELSSPHPRLTMKHKGRGANPVPTPACTNAATMNDSMGPHYALGAWYCLIQTIIGPQNRGVEFGSSASIVLINVPR